MDLVLGRAAPGALDGTVVLLGVTRLGYDVNRTPFGFMPGVEVQATAEKTPFSEEQLLALLALARKGVGKLVDLQKMAVM